MYGLSSESRTCQLGNCLRDLQSLRIGLIQVEALEALELPKSFHGSCIIESAFVQVEDPAKSQSECSEPLEYEQAAFDTSTWRFPTSGW